MPPRQQQTSTRSTHGRDRETGLLSHIPHQVSQAVRPENASSRAPPPLRGVLPRPSGRLTGRHAPRTPEPVTASRQQLRVPPLASHRGRRGHLHALTHGSFPLQPRLRPSTPLSPPPTLLLSLPAFPGGGADGDSESPPSSSPPHPYQPPVALRIPTRSCGCHRIRGGNAVAYILPRGETREAVTGPPEPIVWSGLGRKSRRACPPRVCR